MNGYGNKSLFSLILLMVVNSIIVNLVSAILGYNENKRHKWL